MYPLPHRTRGPGPPSTAQGLPLRQYANRRDGNERAIIDALEAAGATVQQLSAWNVPDLLVGVPQSSRDEAGGLGRTYLLEVKVPGECVSPGQAQWHARWRGYPVAVVTDVDQAMRAVGLSD